MVGKNAENPEQIVVSQWYGRLPGGGEIYTITQRSE